MSERVLFYAHNGVGVGHFRRQLRLASALIERRPDTAVTLITGSHAAGDFAVRSGIELVRLPAIRMLDRYQTWEPRKAGADIAEVIAARSRLLRDTVRRLQPDLLIADFMPAGPYGELVGPLEELSARGGRAVAGFRDIVDEPEFVRRLWQQTGVYEVMRDHYEAVCVYGTRDVLDFERDYGLGGELAGRLHYVGYLGRRRPPSATPSGGIVASSGGGVDGAALLRTFILAARLLGPGIAAGRLVVGGPLLAASELRSLQALAAGAGIEFRRFAPELDELIATSDMVVTMPGYNTTCELLSGSARAIVVPRSGPSMEQRMRAVQLGRWRRASVLEPLGLDAGAMAEAIETALSAPTPPAVGVPLDGIERALDLFESVLAGEAAQVVGR
jgi:predicted glycosyltransferase